MNVENATLAITLALEAGVTPEEIKEALPGFRGVLRRFNIHAAGRTIYVDDYAHHPREVEAGGNKTINIPGPQCDKNTAFYLLLHKFKKSFFGVFAYLIIVLTFVSAKRDEVECKGMRVTVADAVANAFADEGDVVRVVKERYGDVAGRGITEIDKDSIDLFLSVHNNLFHISIPELIIPQCHDKRIQLFASKFSGYISGCYHNPGSIFVRQRHNFTVFIHIVTIIIQYPEYRFTLSDFYV